MRNSLSAWILAAFLSVAATARGLADQPAPPADPSPATTPARDFEAVLADYERLNGEVVGLIGSPDELLDPLRRDEIAVKAVPLLRRLIELSDEMSALSGPAALFGPQLRANVDAVLAIFADPAALARLEAAADDADPDRALRARSSLLFGQWVRTNGDAAAQSAILDSAEALAKNHPASDDLTILLLQMSDAGAASPDIRDRARSVVANVLNGELAKEVKAQFDAEARLAQLEGQPLTIEGTRHNGEPFTSADWKGKVVLVDFFVSDWPPSREQTLRLAGLFKEFHAQGLEIVGICCDDDTDALSQFLQAHPEVSWPQLFDPDSPGVHAIALKLGVVDPQTAILIDRRGMVRSVRARDGLAESIRRLLAE